MPWTLWLSVAAWLTLLPWLWRAHPEARPGAVVGGLLALVATVVLAALGPEGLPRSWILFLHEGREDVILQWIWNRERWLLPWVPDVVPLRARVWLATLAGVVGLGLAAPTLTAIAGRRAGLAVLPLVAASPWLTQTLRSEEPATPLLVLTMLGTHAAAAARAESGRIRALAVVAMLAVVAEAAALRVETVLLSVPVACAVLATAALPTRAERVDAWLAERRPWILLLGLVVLSSAGLAAIAAWAPSVVGDRAVRLVAASPLDPRHVQTLRWPVDLVRFLPWAGAALALVGAWRASRQGVVALVALGGALLLARLYADVGHRGAAPYETLRYLANLHGVHALLIGWGAAALRGRLPRPAWALIALSALVPRMPTAEVPTVPWGEVETDQQLVARALVRAVETWDACLFVTQLAQPGPERPPRFERAWFGPHVTWAGPLSDADLERRLDRAHLPPPDGVPAGVPPAATRAPCVRVWRGADCALDGASCDQLPHGDEVARRDVDLPPWNTHHGVRARPFAITIDRLDPAP